MQFGYYDCASKSGPICSELDAESGYWGYLVEPEENTIDEHNCLGDSSRYKICCTSRRKGQYICYWLIGATPNSSCTMKERKKSLKIGNFYLYFLLNLYIFYKYICLKTYWNRNNGFLFRSFPFHIPSHTFSYHYKTCNMIIENGIACYNHT